MTIPELVDRLEAVVRALADAPSDAAQDAIKYVNARRDGDGYVYHDRESNRNWPVSVDQLEALGLELQRVYRKWCLQS